DGAAPAGPGAAEMADAASSQQQALMKVLGDEVKLSMGSKMPAPPKDVTSVASLGEQLLEMFQQMHDEGGWGDNDQAAEPEAESEGGKARDEILEECKANNFYVKSKTPMYRRFWRWLVDTPGEWEKYNKL
ncbi:unnamed protein product, partial [Prorocentrum cordatum]